MYRNMYQPRHLSRRMQSHDRAQQDRTRPEPQPSSESGSGTAIASATPAGAEAVVADAASAQHDDQGVLLGEVEIDRLEEDDLHRAAARLLGVSLDSAPGAVSSPDATIGQEAMRDDEWPDGVAYCNRLLVDAAVLQAEEVEMLNVALVWLPHILARHRRLLGGDERRLALESATSHGGNSTAAIESTWRLLTGAREETQLRQDREDTAATEAMDAATDEEAAQWSSDCWQQLIEPVWWELCAAKERLRSAERDAAFLHRLDAEAKEPTDEEGWWMLRFRLVQLEGLVERGQFSRLEGAELSPPVMRAAGSSSVVAQVSRAAPMH